MSIFQPKNILRLSLYIFRFLDIIFDYIRSKRNYYVSLIALHLSFSKNITKIWRNLLNCSIKFVGLLRRPEFYRQIVSVKNWIKELRTNFWQHWSGPSGMSHSMDYGHMMTRSQILYSPKVYPIPEVSWVWPLLEGMVGFSSPFEALRTILWYWSHFFVGLYDVKYNPTGKQLVIY